ncbi:ribosome biogenesis GTPase Der [Chromobacterium violaceum]|uniref:GTPase Der n=2 Tax=Chromobacterium violaceum TaxID=536 RepID=DER_CHRVO|nr:ribosome biogenesis GTPase Der [Chromobacterium violaceum]Q7NS92.1 RecName: Full=GTPase Der; AltName: Full=GTP-binding protein EngA [Chromobacterium violaceum ATCC 12472]AAQ61196.1 probable GTP-binding protein [Chromobacterium violaceum ATCC 12472]ATP29819.1 ribosome biogenesis GTPase Der [Chromobacterium violaceum]ATP33725.1 ribosome biogenesis GTPase Der [Chromobacterium violaceum]KJH68583.1 GTP-binding protein Der [Chromobacterium violaceum]MBA8734435.1 ribosome biogenesis GTPase Der [C
MKPTVALVGRPNVGKSTLFNRLTRSRDALVADQPGLTRDRHYGQGRVGEKPYLVVDTGGFEPVVDEGILFEMAKQTLQAVDEADAVVFLVDGRAGLTPQDKIIANRLRQLDRPVFLAVNKAEGMKHAIAGAEFHELALGEPLVISAAHGDGVRELMELVLEGFPDEVEEEDSRHPKFAVIGRPNVGKSTLVNAILGEERVIAFDQAGTTRDSIYIDFEREGHTYTIIDTAGVRRRAKVNEMLEKFSVIKTMKAIEDANVAVLVLDAQLDISEQDATIAGFALEAGRALVVAVNKWDNLDGEQKENVRREIARKLNFLDFAKFHYISAIEGRGVADLFKSIDEAYRAAMSKLATPKLTRVLQVALERQQPPRSGLIRPKMRYAHQGGQNPPVIVVHGNALDSIPASYTRYLEHTFRKVFKLQGTPLRVQYKSSENPFDNDEKDKPRAKPKPMSKMRGREKEVRYGKNSKK